LRVSELCALDKQHVDRAKRKIYVRDAKTEAGVRVIDIRPRLLDDLANFPALADGVAMDEPAYPTRTGNRRDRNNVNARIIAPVVKHANALRAKRHQPDIRAHVTPHTFRRTYITIMLAAGFDLPYVQDQVGHLDPTTTLAIYAKVIRRPDRDAVRAEMRALLGEDRPSDS
jgi:integrase